jgi:hypothetical protein
MNKVVPLSQDKEDDPPVTAPSSSSEKNIKIILEIVGWIGSLSVLIPYVIPLEKKLDFILNTVGASGLLIICIKSRQYQSIIINAAWVIGGIYKYFANSY